MNATISPLSATPSGIIPDATSSAAPDISVVVPVFNEEPNVQPLHAKLREALDKLPLSWEILYIDDGSRDRSFELLSEISQSDPRVKLVRFRRNFGQTAAMAAGMDNAQGKVIIPLDADLQNDPADIPRLLAKMDEGYDVVSGWRQKRKDNSLRRIPSRIANRLISKVTGVSLHDYGCSLKAYRADIMRDVNLYGEMHRFIPAYAHIVGARVTEIPVNHHPRVAGVSKYGIGRVFRVVLDLLVVKFLGGYGAKPIYFFGGAGLWCWAVATVAWLVVLAQKFWTQWHAVTPDFHANRNPLFYIGIMLFLMGAQCIMLGLLAEVNMRTYHESQGKTPYAIAETRNL
ncbi:MAG TPA: glycosyltransferase family 2 protein [Abditibacteriaceae bacterium]